ncbi:mechanosensitive ion channel family protein [Candidatus Micrarchaeota archaeon]|nr:mechanosensitive ion channel family protein [Candidatus Micrarchaeota archaeon]MBU1681368.1 mechanosensitive ion channel family protein [Candidatus Micrarchaeota archaeon]
MLQRIFFFLILIALTAGTWFVSQQYPHPMLDSAINTLIALTILYLVFKLVLDKVVADKLDDPKLRYSFRKAVSFAYVIVLFIAVITIWIPNPEALFVAYGLMAAGIAVALSDLFKNLAGGVIIFFTKPFSVGDRIEISGEFGDIIDVDIMYTTLMEIREWVDGDQATGRLNIVPNGLILTSVVNNYTKDNEFIWDEIMIPITYNSDWKAASNLMLDTVKKETETIIQKSNKEYSHLLEKYYLRKKPAEPGVFMKLTDNWIQLAVRYMTPARERRTLHNQLSKILLTKFEKSKKIKIASATYEIVGLPQIRLKK